MPFFDYRAKSSDGQLQRGKVEAANMESAADTLREKGLFIVSIQPVREKGLSSLKKPMGTMKFKEVVVFTRQLAAIVEAGLTLTTGLSILLQQSTGGARTVIAQILNDIESGMSFSRALEKHPKVFDKSYVYLVQAGESSGSLDVVLNRLADNMEEQSEFKGKVGSALVYPAVVLVVMLAVVVIMMVMVVPKLTEVFDEFGAELPLPTRILIGMSTFMTKYWWALLLIIGVVAGVFAVWYRGIDAKRLVDRILFKIPVFGDLRKKTILTAYTQTLSMLVHAGVPLVESLDLAGESVDSVVYREALEDVESKVEKGVSLGVAIEAYEEFPPIMPQMIKVGEETGKIDTILANLSDYFGREAERAVANLMAAFEPVIMVILGVVVAFLVIAIILPIYNLTDQISV